VCRGLPLDAELQSNGSWPTTLPSPMPAPRTLLPLLACLAVALGASSASAATDDATSVIGPGTIVAGVDLSNLTVAQAAPLLESTLRPRLLAPVTVRIGSRRFQLAGAKAKVKLDALRTARRAYYASRDAAPPVTPTPTPAPTTPPATTPPSTPPVTPAPTARAQGGAVAGVQVPLAISYSRSAVRAWADQVAGQVTRPGRDARLRIGLTSMRVIKARRGLTVDAAALARLAGAALVDPAAARDALRQPLVATDPKVTVAGLRRANGTILTVDRSSFRLRLFKNLRQVKTYGIAVGMAGLDTPSGTYHITSRQVDPAWHVPMSSWAGSLAGQVIPGGAPDNPLKARWLGIQDGVGIHGTGEEWTIGSRASHGCIRMRVADVIDLYPRVPVGTTVLIR
jgi:lipoprotein-anchoring transpeptidase ErfK/SrfK